MQLAGAGSSRSAEAVGTPQPGEAVDSTLPVVVVWRMELERSKFLPAEAWERRNMTCLIDERHSTHPE